ncbi:hypothetical protein HD553DRAFT_342111 [Filobasidium floriforme]|uniref:uncharacterized protein n=1 Tax=Filobasidium floriforme TaxID=5210 RepID=UPI001E8EA314|nr:uncharacterized protein HD553DRAFT_342111 [Filobasidium floriforme]KAH8084621.1 hypothetical protein HD553DRAFT_342111 [Filobasidium floriforme]
MPPPVNLDDLLDPDQLKDPPLKDGLRSTKGKPKSDADLTAAARFYTELKKRKDPAVRKQLSIQRLQEGFRPWERWLAAHLWADITQSLESRFETANLASQVHLQPHSTLLSMLECQVQRHQCERKHDEEELAEAKAIVAFRWGENWSTILNVDPAKLTTRTEGGGRGRLWKTIRACSNMFKLDDVKAMALWNSPERHAQDKVDMWQWWKTQYRSVDGTSYAQATRDSSGMAHMVSEQEPNSSRETLAAQPMEPSKTVVVPSAVLTGLASTTPPPALPSDSFHRVYTFADNVLNSGDRHTLSLSIPTTCEAVIKFLDLALPKVTHPWIVRPSLSSKLPADWNDHPLLTPKTSCPGGHVAFMDSSKPNQPTSFQSYILPFTSKAFPDGTWQFYVAAKDQGVWTARDPIAGLPLREFVDLAGSSYAAAHLVYEVASITVLRTMLAHVHAPALTQHDLILQKNKIGSRYGKDFVDGSRSHFWQAVWPREVAEQNDPDNPSIPHPVREVRALLDHLESICRPPTRVHFLSAHSLLHFGSDKRSCSSVWTNLCGWAFLLVLSENSLAGPTFDFIPVPAGRSVHIPPCFSFTLVTATNTMIVEDCVWACSLLRLYRTHLLLQEGSFSTTPQQEYPELPGRDITPAEPKETVILRLRWLALEACFQQWTSKDGSIPTEFQQVVDEALHTCTAPLMLVSPSQHMQIVYDQIRLLIQRLSTLKDWRGAARLRRAIRNPQ